MAQRKRRYMRPPLLPLPRKNPTSRLIATFPPHFDEKLTPGGQDCARKAVKGGASCRQLVWNEVHSCERWGQDEEGEKKRQTFYPATTVMFVFLDYEEERRQRAVVDVVFVVVDFALGNFPPSPSPIIQRKNKKGL